MRGFSPRLYCAAASSSDPLLEKQKEIVPMQTIWLFKFIVFLAAFLLFQIELIIAKIFLPYYGGSYVVWGACVVFFQLVLLLGYLFIFALIKKLGFHRARWIYLVVFIVPFVGFPGRDLPLLRVHEQNVVVIDILGNLIALIGLVFFALSMASIMLQRWLAASRLPKKTNPYTLYSFSNLGSFLGLLTYPFYFEPVLTIAQQITVWRIGYGVLCFLQLVLFLLVQIDQKDKATAGASVVPSAQVFRWVLLSAAGTMLFLSVTNIITNDIAPVPLLWVIPLAIYLGTFIVSFRENNRCPVWIKERFDVLIFLGVALFYVSEKAVGPILFEILLFYLLLYAYCLRSQCELYDGRPSSNEGLPFYYVMIALGGVLGGIFVSWLIPLITTSFVEFFIGLWVLLLALVINREKSSARDHYLRLLMILGVLIVSSQMHWAFICMAVIIGAYLTRMLEQRLSRAFILMLAAFLFLACLKDLPHQGRRIIYKQRNYYGMTKVLESKSLRYFIHGTTVHGFQSTVAGKQDIPLAYFHPLTPIGKVMTDKHFSFQNIGIIGLGAGSISAYARKDQSVDFFELDPDVYYVADKFFSYLRRSRGKLNYYFGDARLSLAKVPDGKYDLIIVDAFGSDAIPIHLLTLEAVEEYRRKIRKEGLIIFNFTNRFLSLKQVVARAGAELGGYCAFQRNAANLLFGVYSSEWLMLTWDKDLYNAFVLKHQWQTMDRQATGQVRLWTDQYTNILPYIKLRRK